MLESKVLSEILHLRITLANVSVNTKYDPNRDIHLNHSLCADLIKYSLALNKIDYELKGDELILNAESLLNSLERSFIKINEAIGGFSCSFQNPTYLKNNNVDLVYMLKQIKNKKEENSEQEKTNKQERINKYDISLAHSIPLQDRDKESYKLSDFVDLAKKYIIENASEFIEGLFKDIEKEKKGNLDFKDFINALTLSEENIIGILDKILDRAIGGKIYAIDPKNPVNLIANNDCKYDIKHILGEKVEKQKGMIFKTPVIVLDKTYGELAGIYKKAKQVKEKPVFEHKFVFNNDVITSFCNSINLTVEEYLDKYARVVKTDEGEKKEWIITPMLLAYAAVEAYCEFGEQKSEKKYIEDLAKKQFGKEEYDKIRMYNSQSVVSDLGNAIPLNVKEVENEDTGEIRKEILDTSVTMSLYYDGSRRKNPLVNLKEERTTVFSDISFLVCNEEHKPYVAGTGRFTQALKLKQDKT